MRFGNLINFMHRLQYLVLRSDICDSVSFGADDENRRMEIVFRCKESYALGVSANDYIMRSVSYDDLSAEDFDPRGTANWLMNDIEKLYKGEEK